MGLIQIYRCLCDLTRLRILNLLADGPLCVCHFQKVLGEPQVKISKHLAYLKKHGMVEVHREANWMVYRLPGHPTRELKANMACLQDCAHEVAAFRRDRAKLRRRREKFAETSPICCPSASERPKTVAKRIRNHDPFQILQDPHSLHG